MLKTLTVWNFALLEHVEINFEAGLNILTGETGAGKSILIDALGGVLGHRLGADIIRTGCDWSRVEAIFGIEEKPWIHGFLAEQAINDEDDSLIITRQLSAKGKNIILVNGSHVTLTTLRQLGEQLMDIHGQHENLALLKTENQFALLDGSRATLHDLVQAYAACFSAWQAAKTQLETKQAEAKNNADRIDMLRWQAQEIESAQLIEGEDEATEAEIKRLANSERITDNVEAAYAVLQGDDDAEGLLAAIARLKSALSQVGRFDQALEHTLPMVEDASCQLEEIAYAVREYKDRLEFDPAHLDALQGRMVAIDKLRRKYGATVADILAHLENVQAEIEGIENFDGDVEALTAQVASARAEAERAAEALHVARSEAATALSDAVGEKLHALGMPDARLLFELTPTELNARGADDLQIVFSANAGESTKPFAKIASGGELSRIALAVKVIAADDTTSPGSMIFDEIDTGIGGKTAQMVAECIADVAAHKQVLCITHLPQIACMADNHFYLRKETQNGKTTTGVTRLTGDERVREIARMASGMDVSAASINNAREMIRHATARKKAMR